MTPVVQGRTGGARAFSASRSARILAAPAEIKLPDDTPTQAFDFETRGIEGWTTVSGRWVVEEMAGASSGKKVLTQRATKNSEALGIRRDRVTPAGSSPTRSR